MEALLIKYGYVLLFLGVGVEGEAFLLAASVLAHQAILHFPLVIAVAIAGNSAADQVYYLVARTRGRKWLEGRFADNPRYRQVLAAMERHGNWLLLFSRFAFGFRIIIPAACGALGMPAFRFALINTLAGTIWAIPVGLLGYYVGGEAAAALARAERIEVWILVFVGLAVAAFFFLRHVRRADWIKDLEIANVHVAVPFLVAVMGVINLLSAIWPRSQVTVRSLEAWLPLEVTQHSRPIMLFAGLALIQVSRQLARRKQQAWYVAVIALTVSLLAHITRGLDLHHSLVAGLLLLYLAAFRDRFQAQSDPASLRRAFLLAPILFLTVFSYGYLGLANRKQQFEWRSGATPFSETLRSGLLILSPDAKPLTSQAGRFLRSLQLAGWIARFYLLAAILRPVILRDRQQSSAADVQKLFSAYSRYSLSAFGIQPDKHHRLLLGGNALICYAVRGPVALSCGDPLVADGDFKAAVEEYLRYCDQNGWTGCVYEAAEARLAVYHALGLRSLKMAEEAILDLKEFSLAGGKRANLRAMVNKVRKTGVEVRRYRRGTARDAAVDQQLAEISDEWLAEKHMGELGFTLGRFSLEALDSVPVFVAVLGERIVAFCSWLPYRNGRATVLDLMRKRTETPAGTMDFLLTQSVLELQAEGYEEASLANAPLANVAGPHGPLERGVALLFESLNSVYGYKNLFVFKRKFAPDWQGRYLVYPKGVDLPRVAYAMVSVHSSSGLKGLFVRR